MASNPRSSRVGWPTGHAADVPSLFAVERGRLILLLASLAAADWELQTPCPAWSVLGLCAHLLGDDLAWLSRHRDRHLGAPSPPLDELGFAAWLDDLQAEWVHAARRLSPRLIVDLLGWTGPQVVEELRDQLPSGMTGSVSWAGPGPVPVWLDQLRELSEHWIHRQQLLQAVGRPSDLRPDLAGAVLDGLRWAYPYRLSSMAAADGDTVTITISGPVTRTWHLVAQPDGWQYRPAIGSRIVATFALTTEQAWRLLSNNLRAREQAELPASGDELVIDVLRRARAIIGILR